MTLSTGPAKHLHMLSPYVAICYFVAYLTKHGQAVALLTPLLWITTVVGLAILLFQRFYLNKPQYSLIVKTLFGVKSDFVLITGKILILLFLLLEKTKLTSNGVVLAIVVIAAYLLNVDVVSVYAT